MEKKRKMRYSNGELQIIKSEFWQNETKLAALNKFFRQGQLNEEEQAIISSLSERMFTVQVLRKTFLPEIDAEAPLFETADLYVSIPTSDRSVDQVNLDMENRQIMWDYLNGLLCQLEGKDAKQVSLLGLTQSGWWTSKRRKAVNLAARNLILAHVDRNIQQLQFLAELPEESKDTETEKAEKNSSK